MRLICPSCRAQYEVDDNAIPAEGRDVQCGSCSTTWFQEHALTLAGALQAPVTETTKPIFRHQTVTETGIPAPQPMPDDSPADREKLLREIRAEAEQESSLDAVTRTERAPVDPDGDFTAPGTAAARTENTLPADAKSPETDLNTSDVHAYSAEAAAASSPAENPASSVEESFMQSLRSQIAEQDTQTEDVARTRSSSVISAAEKAGITIDPAKVPASAEAAKSDALQRSLRDISSTPEPAPRRRSFSLGVYTAAVLFLLAFAAYLLRDEISRYYPSAGPWLESYANVVDYLRRVVQDLWAYGRDWVTGLIG